MYISVATKNFKKSLKKIERSGQYHISDVEKMIEIIVSGKKLDAKYQDHKLKGDMLEYRECHNKSDLLLVCRIKKEELVLLLINIKNHSNLFK